MSWVLDTSVAVGLLLEEDDERGARRGLFRAEHPAIVPTLFIHEVTNSLVNAVRRTRVDPARAHWLLRQLASLPIEVDDRPTPASRIFELAMKHSLSAYDACYLELAVSQSLPLATNDRALTAAAKAEGVAIA